MSATISKAIFGNPEDPASTDKSPLEGNDASLPRTDKESSPNEGGGSLASYIFGSSNAESDGYADDAPHTTLPYNTDIKKGPVMTYKKTRQLSVTKRGNLPTDGISPLKHMVGDGEKAT